MSVLSLLSDDKQGSLQSGYCARGRFTTKQRGIDREGQEVIALTADVDTVHVDTFLLEDLDLGQADPLSDLSVRRDRQARGFRRSGAGAGGCPDGRFSAHGFLFFFREPGYACTATTATSE